MRKGTAERHKEGLVEGCRSNGTRQTDVPLPEQNLSDLTQRLHCLQMKSQHAGQRQTPLLWLGAAVHIPKERWSYTKIQREKKGKVAEFSHDKKDQLWEINKLQGGGDPLSAQACPEGINGLPLFSTTFHLFKGRCGLKVSWNLFFWQYEVPA